MNELKKFKVIIPYFDSGTKKEHTVEFVIESRDKTTALKAAREKFESYEKSAHASWVRLIREDGIKVEEK